MNAKNVSRFNIFARLTTALTIAAMMASPVFVRAQDPGYYDSQQSDQADPPSIVGRLSVLQGNVSLQSAGVQDFSAAELNYPLTTGDRLYTDNGARGEVQAGQLSIRLGAQTDFTVTALSDSLAQFGLAQGSVHLRSFSFDPNSATEVDTPNATVSLMSQGDVRVDVYPQDNVTVVTVLQGQAHVDADGVQQNLQQGQSFQVSGANPSRAQFVGRQRTDDLDRFSSQRDATYQQAFSSEGSYVNPATIGADDLAGYGDWDNSADYGPVWYPRSVTADWAPYSNGHWANIAPWGWTWVGAEPWGFAPYHYGRWARFGNRWGWVPGPQVVRPVYSPALVVFVGGPTFARGGFSVTLGGGGVAAWFPLGPREAYHPWYRSSDRYVNRVNVTNIYNRNTVEVRNVYNNRTNVYANAPSNYANRGVATIAVSQRDFGSGRQVRQSAVRVDPRQFQNAPVLNRAPVEAQQQTGSRPPARAVPARTERPVLETHGNGNPNAPRGPRDGYNNGGRPGQQQQNPVAGQPNRGNNGQPVPSTQPAPNNGNAPYNGGRGNDGRYNNGRGTQPGQIAPGQAAPVQQNPAPGTAGQAAPIVNGGRGQDGRFNNGRGTQPGQTAPAQPATAPGTPGQVPPVVNGGRGQDGRYNNGRGTQPGQTAPVQPTPAPGTPAQAAPVVNGGRGQDGRFNNGRNPGQPAQTPPVTTQPAPQTPPVVPANPNDAARPGPRRQAPDAPVRADPQPQQQEQQRQQQLQQQQLEQQRQQQLQQQQTQQQNQQRQQQLEQQRQQQLQQQQTQEQNQQRQQQLEQQRQQQLQQQQSQQQNQQRQQQLEQQRQQQLQQQQTQQQNQQRQQQLEQQRQQREAQPPAPRPAPPAQQPAPQQPRPQQQAAPERRQPPPARPVTPPDDKKKE